MLIMHVSLFQFRIFEQISLVVIYRIESVDDDSHLFPYCHGTALQRTMCLAAVRRNGRMNYLSRLDAGCPMGLQSGTYDPIAEGRKICRAKHTN